MMERHGEYKIGFEVTRGRKNRPLLLQNPRGSISTTILEISPKKTILIVA